MRDSARKFRLTWAKQPDMFSKRSGEWRIIPAKLDQIIEAQFRFALANVLDGFIRHAGMADNFTD